MFINGFIVFSLLISFMFFYGIIIFLSDYKENKCEMTYMFQYPQFVKISQDADYKYKKYGLYAYSEGHFTERARNKHFDGIPVLFIPGNAGSHKQVRSLASVALRKSLDTRPGFHFDYFTLDFNGELTAFNGALLQEQMEYTNHSLYQILELYDRNYVKPASIILIGHSMGGIIAESLLGTQRKGSSLISLVITLAAPHKRLPVVFDSYAASFYQNIQKSHDPERKTTLVSLAGGYEDFLVPVGLTKGGHLNTVTTHVPKVWLSVDHLCILWCKQLVLALNRALFESVDRERKQISLDSDYRLSVFYHHLVRNSGTKVYLAERYKKMTNIDSKGEWIEYLPRQYSIRLPQGTGQIHWYMMRLVNQPRHEVLTLLAVNLEVTDWIYACSASVIEEKKRICEEGIHLSHLSEIVPSIKFKRRIIEVNMHELQKNYSYFSHVVAKVLPTSEPVTLHVDIYSAGERIILVNLPNRFSLRTEIIIEETAEKAITYNLDLSQLYHITQSYQLFVEPMKCKTQTHHATAALVVPWSHQNTYCYFTETEHQPMDIRLYTSKPNDMVNSSAYVKLTLDPECRYRISIKASVPNIFSQLARFYSPLLIANIAAVVLITFRHQLAGINANGTCPFFFTSLKIGAKPYYVLPFVKITSAILGSNLVILKFLPTPDWHILQEERMDFMVLPFFLYFVSIGIVWILAALLSVSILFFESTVHKLALKLISKSMTGPLTWSDWLMKALHKLPGFMSCMLVLLSFSTCGGLALCLGVIFYFLKLTQMSQDVLEEIVTRLVTIILEKIKKRNAPLQNTILSLQHEANASSKSNNSENPASTSEIETKSVEENGDFEVLNGNKSVMSLLRDVLSNNQIFFHFTIFGLWFLVTILNVPSVITWAHNFRYSPSLENDPSFLPGVILCTCAFPLWQFEFPRINKKWYKEIEYIVYFSSVISLLYGLINLYILNYILTSIITIVTLHQLFAPNRSSEPQTEEESSPGPKEYYDRAKQKMD